MLYVIELPESAQSLVYDGRTKYVVRSHSEAAALALVQADQSSDLNVIWDNATITEQVLDLEGVEFSIAVGAVGTATVVAAAGDTFEDVAADMVTALLAVAGTPFINTAWTLHTPEHGTILIDDGTGTVGDQAVTATATAADGTTDVSAQFFGNVVDQGLAAAALSVDLVAGTDSLIIS